MLHITRPLLPARWLLGSVIEKSNKGGEPAEALDKSDKGKEWAEYLESLSPEDFGKYKV